MSNVKLTGKPVVSYLDITNSVVAPNYVRSRVTDFQPARTHHSASHNFHLARSAISKVSAGSYYSQRGLVLSHLLFFFLQLRHTGSGRGPWVSLMEDDLVQSLPTSLRFAGIQREELPSPARSPAGAGDMQEFLAVLENSPSKSWSVFRLSRGSWPKFKGLRAEGPLGRAVALWPEFALPACADSSVVVTESSVSGEVLDPDGCVASSGLARTLSGPVTCQLSQACLAIDSKS